MSPLRTQQRTLISRLRQVLTWTFTGSCVVAGGWAAADAIAHADTFQVQEVRFVGTEKAPTGQLRHLADVQTGTHLFHADLSAAIKGVEAGKPVVVSGRLYRWLDPIFQSVWTRRLLRIKARPE